MEILDKLDAEREESSQIASLINDIGDNTVESIRKLNDTVSESVLFEYVSRECSMPEWQSNGNNKLELYKNAYDTAISNLDPDVYADNKDELTTKIEDACKFVEDNLYSRYGIKIGSSPEYTAPNVRLGWLVKMYEFFIVRACENVSEFMLVYITQHKNDFAGVFKNEVSNKDIFHVLRKKQSENLEYSMVLQYISEIITNIRDAKLSADEYINAVCDSDPDEVVNDYIKEAFTTNFGNQGSFDNGFDVYGKIMADLYNKHNFDDCVRIVLEKILKAVDIF